MSFNFEYYIMINRQPGSGRPAQGLRALRPAHRPGHPGRLRTDACGSSGRSRICRRTVAVGPAAAHSRRTGHDLRHAARAATGWPPAQLHPAGRQCRRSRTAARGANPPGHLIAGGLHPLQHARSRRPAAAAPAAAVWPAAVAAAAVPGHQQIILHS